MLWSGDPFCSSWGTALVRRGIQENCLMPKTFSKVKNDLSQWAGSEVMWQNRFWLAQIWNWSVYKVSAGQLTHKEYGDTDCAGFSKATAYLELNLARMSKATGIIYIKSRSLSIMGYHCWMGKNYSENYSEKRCGNDNMFIACFPSVFTSNTWTSNTSPQQSQVLGLLRKTASRKSCP